jgi:hypothetical protein
MIEKRFEQIKTVQQIAPVFLKNPGRIEALFTLYFLALLVQALIERAGAAARDEARENQRTTDLPQAAPLQTTNHRANPATLQPLRTPHTASPRQTRPVLPAAAHRYSAPDPRSAQHPGESLHRLNARAGNSRQIMPAMCAVSLAAIPLANWQALPN